HSWWLFSGLTLTDLLPLIATLQYHDFPILSIHRKSPQHAYFEYEDTTELREISKRYWNGELLVEPKMFFAVIKEVKSRIYEHNYE
ncbi:MAG: hypothetical protein ACD_51C00219G0001, partial [uncultured bacterium]